MQRRFFSGERGGCRLPRARGAGAPAPGPSSPCWDRGPPRPRGEHFRCVWIAQQLAHELLHVISWDHDAVAKLAVEPERPELNRRLVLFAHPENESDHLGVAVNVAVAIADENVSGRRCTRRGNAGGARSNLLGWPT